MPDDVPHSCHTCASVGAWYADGAHCWCRRHLQTQADPLGGCAYWTRGKNAHLVTVPERVTLSSAEFPRMLAEQDSYLAEMRRQAQALMDNKYRPDPREGRAVRTGDVPAGFIAPDVWKAMNVLCSERGGGAPVASQ